MLRRHSRTIDLTQVPQPQRDVLQAALNEVTYPLGRILQNTGHKVPVTVADLSRYAAQLGKSAHAHVHRDVDGEEQTGHLLGSPVGNSAAGGKARAAALGLYWLPTRGQPAGSIQVDAGALEENPDLAREVMVAELAHAVDYGVMSDTQRETIRKAYEDQPGEKADWFEEHGEQNYWAWAGESFMEGFTRAYAPTLPRPLSASQPWVHTTTDRIVATIRRTLR